MDTPVIAYLIPYLLSAGTSAAIGAYAWGRQSVPGSRQFAVLAMAQAVATLGFIFELVSVSLQAKIFWENVQTVALFVWPVAYLAFATRFSGRQLPDRKVVWAVLAVPFVIFLALLFTDPFHELVRQHPHIEAGEPFAALIFGYSLPIYFVGIYSYAFIITALYLLGKKYINPSPIYRGQVGTVIAGTMIPVVVGMLTTTGIRLTFQGDPTPITFALGNLVVAWGLYRYRLFDLVPVARGSIVESMQDGVIVLDGRNRIVDINPAAQRLLRGGAAGLVGQAADSALAHWPDLLEAAAKNEPAHFEMNTDGGAIVEASLEPIDERRGHPDGWMFVLRDISDHKAMEFELEQHRHELETLVAARTAALTLANEQLGSEAEERERAERALGSSEARLIQFLDALPVGVVVHGPDTKPRYVNHQALKLVGIALETARGVGADYSMTLAKSLNQFPIYRQGEEEPYPTELSPIARALDGERVRSDDIELQIDGHRIPLEVLASPIYDQQGRVQYAVTAFQDISERRRLEDTLEAIFILGRDLALIRDEDAIGRRVVEEAHHLLDFELAGFGLADEPSRLLIYGYSILGIDEQETFLRLPLEGKVPQSISANVYRTGEPMNVPDVSKEPLYHLETQEWDGRSELCVPIRVGERILGVLNAESRQLNRFNRDDQRLLQALADQCGVAVENARLYSELQQRLKEQTALQNAVSSISSKIELNEVLDEIASRLGEAIDATSAFICAYDDSRMTTRVLAHYVSPEANAKELSAPEGTYSLPEFFPGTVRNLQASQPAVSFADDPDLPEAQRKHYNDFDTLTSLFIPMRVGGRMVAYADLWDSRERREFSPQEIALCEGIAQQAAVAMENARLYARAQEELVERQRIEDKLHLHQEELEDLVMERTAKLSEASERLATLNDASRVLGVASVDSEQVHFAIHRAVSWLMSAEIFSISIVDHDQAAVEDVYTVGRESRKNGSRYPVENTLVEYMLHRGSSLRIDDVQMLDEANPVNAYVEPDTRSALAVLLPGSDQSMGIMLAQSKSCASYSEEDEKILEMLAAHAATALENVQLYLVAQRAAADEERQRLARHLHDSVTQSLYSLALMTNGWAAMSDKGELENPAESFRQLEELSVQALGEMRLLIHQLRPTVLEETGLVGALQERLEAVEHRVGLETKLQTEGDIERLPLRVEEEFFHITQEALNNALRHADASNISVRIAVQNGSASLSVADDGNGFDPAITNGGLGLITMRERAESLGGDFQLISDGDNGTVVEVRLTLSKI
jgi:PAS domain S-box-containing protein